MMKKIILAGIVVCLICSIGSAADRSDSTPSTGLQKGAGGMEINTDKLVLEEKGDDYFLYCSRRFDVTSHTIIKNDRGRVISFDRVPIPCEAMVSYYKKPRENYRFVAVTIEVIGEPQPDPE